MRKFLSIAICTLNASILALGSCAGGAASSKPATAAAPAAKVAKTRTVKIKVPVLVKETVFYADGLVDGYTVYKLDGAGKAAVERSKYDASRPEPVERTVFEYKDGRPVAESLFESDGKLRSRRELGYDSAGRLASERLADAKGAVLSASAYSYDSKGRKAEWRALDGSGATKAVTTYAYGPEGLSAVEMRDSAGALAGTIKSEYEGGRLARRIYAGPSGEAQKLEVYAYSGTGALPASLEIRRPDGSLVARTAYEYGASGEPIKATEYLPSGSASSYATYEYAVREDSSTETYYE
jgi:hypothetical protein